MLTTKNNQSYYMPQPALFLSGEILKRANAQSISISNMSLQKLLFIANGVHLAQTGQPLITDPIEVWPYGPVVKSVYHEFKEYGNADIKKIPLVYSLSANKNLDPTEDQAVDFALEVAQKLNAIQLSNWTHLPESPWTKANEKHEKVISNDSMELFFKQFLNQPE